MHFGLIIIGDEILSGKRQDMHLSKCTELLGQRGLGVAYARYVGDDPPRITEALSSAFASGDVVFSFGGIGATPDDHTRACAAAALGTPLELHPQAAALIRERMQDVAREQGHAYEPDSADNLRRLQMGMFPQGAEIIPNPYNKIAGFTCRGAGGGAVHFVPGFPVMAWPMVEWVLDMRYSSLFARGLRMEQSIIVFGAMEAALTPLMESLEKDFPVKVFSLPSVDHPQFGKHVELGVKGDPNSVEAAFGAMCEVLKTYAWPLGPTLVRKA